MTPHGSGSTPSCIPAVRELTSRLLPKVEGEDPDAVVVYDVPLLVEAAVDHPFDLIVVTSAPKRTQVERLVEERGLDPNQAQARVDAQVDNTERVAVADVVIDTDGSIAHTMSQVDALWHRIKQERAGPRLAPGAAAHRPECRRANLDWNACRPREPSVRSRS